MDGTFIQELKKVLDEGTGTRVTVAGREFIKGRFTEIEPKHNDFPETIEFSDLRSFAEIVNAEKSQLVPNGKYYVKIDSHDEVSLISDLTDKFKKRSKPYHAHALTPMHKFGTRMDYESFVIWLRSAFVPNEDVCELIKLIAGIVHTEEQEMMDNGMTQTVTTKKGTISKTGEVKSIVKLRPYRTFSECEQPESEFLFRIQDNGRLFALYEADGGKWKLTAKENIKKYLNTVIKEDNGVSILF